VHPARPESALPVMFESKTEMAEQYLPLISNLSKYSHFVDLPDTLLRIPLRTHSFGRKLGNQNRTCSVLQLKSVPTILLTRHCFIRISERNRHGE